MHSTRDDRHDEPLSAEERELLLPHLHRFARHDLDLFAALEVGDPAYPACPTLTRDPVAGMERAGYRRP
ncbi:hypothetical protein [Streptomyces sp. NPDC053427]|uniref:hypothetical protein n=1 Tax=Streptomyces sp. NPDC053427 TaxID=3365701 RepID=UPI0037D62F52